MRELLAETYDNAQTLPSSLWEVLRNGAKANANRPAITSMHQPVGHLAELLSNDRGGKDGPLLSWTYAELEQATLRLAAGLLEIGVERGSTIALFLPSGIEGELMLWVSTVLQVTFVPLDPGLLHSGREEQLDGYLLRLLPQTVLVVGPEGADSLDRACKRCDVAATTLLTVEEIQKAEWLSLTNAAGHASSSSGAVDRSIDAPSEDNGNRVAAILFTSGTSSGRPKGCPLTARNLLNTITNDLGLVDFPSSIVMHSAAFRTIWLATSLWSFKHGIHVIIPSNSFSTTTTLDAIDRCKAEFMVAIPIQIHLFARDSTLKQRDLTSLRYVCLGGDMITTDAVNKAFECFPNVTVLFAHGMTEGGGVFGGLGHTRGLPVTEYGGILPIGKPCPAALVRICDAAGKVVRRGQPSDLHVGGPSVIDHYLSNEQEEAFYRDEHGSWLRSGDIAMMDDDRRIYILGRSKDVIKKTGISLSPAIIESMLNRHEGVEVCWQQYNTTEYRH